MGTVDPSHQENKAHATRIWVVGNCHRRIVRAHRRRTGLRGRPRGGTGGRSRGRQRNRRVRVRMVASVRLRVRVLLLPADHVRAVQGDRRPSAMGRPRRMGLRRTWLGSRWPDRPGLRRPRRPAAIRADAPEVAPARPRRSRRRAAGLGFRFGRSRRRLRRVDRRRAPGSRSRGRSSAPAPFGARGPFGAPTVGATRMRR